VTEQPQGLTPKLRGLVAIDRNSRPPVGRLSQDEVAALIAIIRREITPDVAVSDISALAALAVGAPPGDAIPVLAGTLADRTAASANRVAAARGLGRIGGAAAQQALLSQVGDPNARVQQAVLTSLGAVGDPAAGAQLARLPIPDDPGARRQLVLTRALITHRHGLAGPFLPLTPTRTGPITLPGPAAAVSLAPVGTADIVGAPDRLGGSTYGIGLSNQGYALRCGRADWTVLVNSELGPSLASPRVFERAWIAAILVQQLPEGRAVMPRLAVLTRPVAKGLRLDIVRTDGLVAYAGEAQPDGEANTFSITDIDRPGTAPTQLAGRVTPRGIDLTTALASDVRVGSQLTSPVNPVNS
jgi:hypothetical protein